MKTMKIEVKAVPVWRDYWELTKPRVVALMLLTSVIGMFMATRSAANRVTTPVPHATSSTRSPG